jgi:hypothetical protein
MELRCLYRINLLSVTFCTLLLCGPAGAAVWTIGPGGYFGEIQQGIQAANDGDLLLVQPGSYETFLIDDLSVSIIAETNGTVQVHGGVTIRNLDPSRTVVLAGLDCYCSSSDARDVLILENNAGGIRLEQCGFIHNGESFHFEILHGAVINNCEDVAFVRCTVKAGLVSWSWFRGAHAMESAQSTIVIHESTLLGGQGPESQNGGCAFFTENASLFASGAEFHGGDGGKGQDSFGFLPATDGGDGGDAVFLQGPDARFHYLDCVLEGGAGGPGGAGYGSYPPGEPGEPGLPINAVPGSTVHAFSGSAFDFHVDSPARESEIAEFTFTGSPGGCHAALFLSLQTGTHLFHGLKGQFLLSLVPPPMLVYLGKLDHTGTLSVRITTPELGTHIDYISIHLQSYFWDGTGLEVLGAPQTVFLLDAEI